MRYKSKCLVCAVSAVFVLSGLIELRARSAEPKNPGNDKTAGQIRVKEEDEFIQIDTDKLQARVVKKGYVSGLASRSFLDRQTGARDAGFGLHIMDFLLAPGWRDDGYSRDAKFHGNLPKHYVEGPQICTQARKLEPELMHGPGFVAVRLRYTFHQPGKGYKAGSRWVQTLVFQPGVRYVLSAEEITSVNDVEDVFYRIDMPGHIRHRHGDTFERIYLSYAGEISAKAFTGDFAPDDRYLYRRTDGRVPERMIRAYQIRLADRPGPWLAGMTLDPAAVSEAWCHQRGYVCMIQENHLRRVRAGETFGAAYIVGWFDTIGDMNRIYDRHKGAGRIVLSKERFELKPAPAGQDAKKQ